MPRKPGGAPKSCFDLRITPTDQLPITDWSLLEVAEKYMAFQEGGEGTTKKLHYHIYLEGTVSESWLKNQCAIIGRATQHIKGNQVFKCGKAHEHTIGYIVKERNCISRKGFDEKVLEEYYANSEAYAKKIAADAKRGSRKRESSLDDLFKMVDLSKKPDAEYIVKEVLKLCHERNVRFPTKSQMETRIMTLMYSYNSQYVDGFYVNIFYPRLYT